ncbi:MAG: hypothetical protein WA215_07950 [Candidatus Cybelea sp.]
MGARRLYRRLAIAGLFLVTFAVTLATHAALEYAQFVGLLHGDYGSHTHASLVPVTLGSLTAALCAISLYAAYLANLDKRSLPSLARALRAKLGWQVTVAISVAASVLLFGMEASEQLAAGRLDGLLSAFGAVPAYGLGLIVIFSAAGNAILRALCTRLIAAHTRMISLIAFLLQDRTAGPEPLCALLRGELPSALCCACDASRVHGKRGPPVFAS